MTRVRAPIVSIIALALLASACGGDDGGSRSAAGAGESGDDCALLTDDEIETATGLAPMRAEGPRIGRGCSWFREGDVLMVTLDIGDDEATIDGEPGSRYQSVLDRHEASSIESADVDGLGDMANASGSPVPNNVIVVVGDRFLELTINETDALTASTVEDLMASVIGRL